MCGASGARSSCSRTVPSSTVLRKPASGAVGRLSTFSSQIEIGEIFEYQDDMAVAGLKNLSEKLTNLGCGCAARALLPLSSPPSPPHPLDPLPFTLRRAHPHRREQTHEPVENLKLLS